MGIAACHTCKAAGPRNATVLPGKNSKHKLQSYKDQQEHNFAQCFFQENIIRKAVHFTREAPIAWEVEATSVFLMDPTTLKYHRSQASQPLPGERPVPGRSQAIPVQWEEPACLDLLWTVPPVLCSGDGPCMHTWLKTNLQNKTKKS